MPTRPRAERERLSRQAVLLAAIELADREGFESLSMRTLAARLGVVPMALYKHVSDRADLVGGMVDQAILSYAEPPQSLLDWNARVRFRVLAARSAYLDHPWLGAAIEGQTRRTHAVLAHMDLVAGEFIDGGVSPDLTHYAMHALGNRIWGYSREAFPDEAAPTPADGGRAAVAEYMTRSFPHVVAIALDAVARNPAGCDQQDEFVFALELLLDGFERLHASAWESRPATRAEEH